MEGLSSSSIMLRSSSGASSCARSRQEQQAQDGHNRNSDQPASTPFATSTKPANRAVWRSLRLYTVAPAPVLLHRDESRVPTRVSFRYIVFWESGDYGIPAYRESLAQAAEKAEFTAIFTKLKKEVWELDQRRDKRTKTMLEQSCNCAQRASMAEAVHTPPAPSGTDEGSVLGEYGDLIKRFAQGLKLSASSAPSHEEEEYDRKTPRLGSRSASSSAGSYAPPRQKRNSDHDGSYQRRDPSSSGDPSLSSVSNKNSLQGEQLQQRSVSSGKLSAVSSTTGRLLFRTLSGRSSASSSNAEHVARPIVIDVRPYTRTADVDDNRRVGSEDGTLAAALVASADRERFQSDNEDTADYAIFAEELRGNAVSQQQMLHSSGKVIGLAQKFTNGVRFSCVFAVDREAQLIADMEALTGRSVEIDPRGLGASRKSKSQTGSTSNATRSHVAKADRTSKTSRSSGTTGIISATSMSSSSSGVTFRPLWTISGSQLLRAKELVSDEQDDRQRRISGRGRQTMDPVAGIRILPSALDADFDDLHIFPSSRKELLPYTELRYNPWVQKVPGGPSNFAGLWLIRKSLQRVDAKVGGADGMHTVDGIFSNGMLQAGFDDGRTKIIPSTKERQEENAVTYVRFSYELVWTQGAHNALRIEEQISLFYRRLLKGPTEDGHRAEFHIIRKHLETKWKLVEDFA
ncbi:unnamed protein product [Amoebophrya sp. A25]|nr:unnamed protein product [Amoebophrya sp. A25]|eukprot:GSA25T00024773001.1